MGRYKSAVGIKLRAVKNNVEIFITQRSATGVEIKFINGCGLPVSGESVFGIKLYAVKTEFIRAFFNLGVQIFL